MPSSSQRSETSTGTARAALSIHGSFPSILPESALTAAVDATLRGLGAATGVASRRVVRRWRKGLRIGGLVVAGRRVGRDTAKLAVRFDLRAAIVTLTKLLLQSISVLYQLQQRRTDRRARRLSAKMTHVGWVSLHCGCCDEKPGGEPECSHCFFPVNAGRIMGLTAGVNHLARFHRVGSLSLIVLCGYSCRIALARFQPATVAGTDGVTGINRLTGEGASHSFCSDEPGPHARLHPVARTVVRTQKGSGLNLY